MLQPFSRLRRGVRRIRQDERVSKCLWCHAPVRLAIAAKHRGVCPLCIAEIAELRWRVVYDRDRGIGAIPRNLRASYKL